MVAGPATKKSRASRATSKPSVFGVSSSNRHITDGEGTVAKSETAYERRRRSAVRMAGQPLFFQPDPDRLDVELLLQTMEHLVADDAPVAKRDEGASLRGERLVPEPAKSRLGPSRVGADPGIDQGGALDSLRVEGAHPLDVRAGRIRRLRQVVKMRQRRAARLLAGVGFLELERGVVAEPEPADEG